LRVRRAPRQRIGSANLIRRPQSLNDEYWLADRSLVCCRQDSAQGLLSSG